ncbi:MAG: hypothetical protein Q4B28_02885 [bacterium]|nr:hypothetical protein [bacterium]
MVVLFQALALEAYFKRRKKSDFCRFSFWNFQVQKKLVLDLLGEKVILFVIFGFYKKQPREKYYPIFTPRR